MIPEIKTALLKSCSLGQASKHDTKESITNAIVFNILKVENEPYESIIPDYTKFVVGCLITLKVIDLASSQAKKIQKCYQKFYTIK